MKIYKQISTMVRAITHGHHLIQMLILFLWSLLAVYSTLASGQLKQKVLGDNGTENYYYDTVEE
jgi:hypothetical protein